MLIRKLFKFEGAHIVRNCFTDKCKLSIHGHSYRAEVFLEGSVLDKGQMLVDFTLVKKWLGGMIDAFDHTMLIWEGDTAQFIASMVSNSERFITLPVSPTAEQLSRLILCWATLLVDRGVAKEGFQAVEVKSVIVHETDTGYAQAFRKDIIDQKGMTCPELHPSRAIFSHTLLTEYPVLASLQEIL